jgi:hypothetical protein
LPIGFHLVIQQKLDPAFNPLEALQGLIGLSYHPSRDLRTGSVGKQITWKRQETRRYRKVYEKVRTDFSLGRGEAEANAPAFEKKAKIVAIDDRSGKEKANDDPVGNRESPVAA